MTKHVTMDFNLANWKLVISIIELYLSRTMMLAQQSLKNLVCVNRRIKLY